MYQSFSNYITVKLYKMVLHVGLLSIY